MQAPHAPHPQSSHPYAPPAFAPVPPRPGWPRAARVAVGCGSCCGLLVLLEVLVFWVALQIGFGIRPPEGLKAAVTPPESVAAGKTFPLTLVVRNEGAEALTIKNLIVRDSTLKRVRLSNPLPAPQSTTTAWGTTMWSYSRGLAPKDTWTVRFDAVAAQPGEVAAAVEVQAGISAPRRARFRLRVVAD